MVRARVAPLASPSVFALAIAACGLAPVPAPSPAFPGDGVAGFGDASPIEVCLGQGRVLAPDLASSADSLCVAASGQGAPCTDDSTCSGIEQCVCGQCIVEPCDTGADCAEGQVCNDNRCTTGCATDGDCASGETCSAGGCTRPCSHDADCHYGERCDDLFNVCATKLCSASMPCAPGDRCQATTVSAELHEPEIAVIDGEPVAYVELRPNGPGSGTIYRASVDGPGQWTADPMSPLPGATMGEGQGAPSLLVDGASVEMYFAIGDGKGIGHAVSSDGGHTFTPDAAPVLVPAAGWESGWIGSPSAVRFQGSTLLFYEGGPRAGVGMARVGSSGATRAGDGPVVTPSLVASPLFWRDVTEVGAPYAVVVGDILRVYFTGRGVEGSDAVHGDAAIPADPNDSIGLVATSDAVTFSPYPTGPVLARITNLRAYLGEREASVRLFAGGGAEITFVSTDASGTAESGLAAANE
jgi:hypothetical protein